MAGEAIQPLLSAGPFNGVDNTTADIYTDPTKAYSIASGDCEVVPKALIAKYGRTNLANLTYPQGAIAVNGAGWQNNSNIYPQTVALVSISLSEYYANSSVAGKAYVYGQYGVITTSSAGFPAAQDQPIAFPFTQAIVALTPVFTDYTGGAGGAVVYSPQFIDNYGVQTCAEIASGYGGSPSYTQHDAPISTYYTVLNGIQVVGTGTGTNVTAGTYTYAYTYSTGSVLDSGLIAHSPQETTPFYSDNPVTLAAPGAITLTPIGTTLWYGTFPLDTGAQYATNIYRKSTNQPVYYYVGSVSSGSGLFPTSTFNDNSSDATISANAQLVLNRDTPPVKQYGDFVHEPANSAGGNLLNAQPTYYPGCPIELHQGRSWYFAFVQNNDTNNEGQFQLWYSNLNRAWEMDKINNVFLVDLPSTTWAYTLGTYPPTAYQNPYAYPRQVFNEMPQGMKSLGSVLLFWTTKRMYTLYGNSPSTYVFQKTADLGCQSMNSVTYAASDTTIGVFWLSENGVYFSNGSGIQYISENIRHMLDGLTLADRYQAAGFYSNHTYYISFPVSNQTWAYRTTTNQWHGPINYAAVAAFSTPSDSAMNATLTTTYGMNSVVAIRAGAQQYVDQWFNQVDTDLGIGQTVVYTSRDQGGQNPHIEKEFTHIAISHKKMTAASTLVATVEVDDDPTKTCSVTFDLTLGPVQIATMSYEGLGGGPLRGFLANLTLTYTTVAGNSTAPIKITSCTVYGKYMSRNLTPTVSMN